MPTITLKGTPGAENARTERSDEWPPADEITRDGHKYRLVQFSSEKGDRSKPMEADEDTRERGATYEYSGPPTAAAPAVTATASE